MRGREAMYNACTTSPLCQSAGVSGRKRVTVVLVQGHPSSFFSVVHRKVCLGYKNGGEGASRQNPTKLNAKDQEEEVDMARKVFMRLYTVAFKGGII